MNFLWIMGRLGVDAEVRFTTNGRKVTTLRVAVNEWRNGKDETLWYRVTIWGDRYDKMVPYLTKGSGVVVGGTFHKPEIYTDKNGQPQPSLEITAEYLSFNPFGGKTDRPQQPAGQAAAGYPFPPDAIGGAADDDYGMSQFEQEHSSGAPQMTGSPMPF